MARRKPERDASFVRDLNQDYLTCRTMRHAWRVVYFGKVREVDKEYLPRRSIFRVIVRIAECDRCGTLRREFFNEAGQKAFLNGDPFNVLARQYVYPAAYQHRGDRRPIAKDYNYEMLRRWRVEA